MLVDSLAKKLNIPQKIPVTRQVELQGLQSQTSLQQRETLYALARHSWSGQGDIWDIGCAAGGSSYCLGAGAADSEVQDKAGRVKCFDLFDGRIRRRFEGGNSHPDDLTFFKSQTEPFKGVITPYQLDLLNDLPEVEISGGVEIAHIDAAKDLELWKAIFTTLAKNVIPGRSIWIYQDFNRGRLPFLSYSLPLILRHGRIIGGAKFGVVIIQLDEMISDEAISRIIADDFTIDERLTNAKQIFSELHAHHSGIFGKRLDEARDLEQMVTAYCHLSVGDRDAAKAAYGLATEKYRSRNSNRVYYKEIFGM